MTPKSPSIPDRGFLGGGSFPSARKADKAKLQGQEDPREQVPTPSWAEGWYKLVSSLLSPSQRSPAPSQGQVPPSLEEISAAGEMQRPAPAMGLIPGVCRGGAGT